MNKNFVSNVFLWLFIGLLITFGSGYAISNSESLLMSLYSTSGYIILIILQVVIAIALSAAVNKLSPLVCKILYILYALLTGVTFASIFILYNVGDIIFIFLITSILFGIFGLIGKLLKVDLNNFGVYLLMGLLMLILLEIINIFLLNNTLNLIACILGIIIFLGYIVYDMQRVIRLAEYSSDDKMAVYCAFQLYLDFINLFIKLLRLFGRRND